MELCFQGRCLVCLLPNNSESLQEEEDEFDIPVKKRKCTDTEYFNILVIFLTFVGLSAVVAFLRGDLRRLVHGYDDFGNICGIRNDPIRGVNQSGMDYSKETFLLINQVCGNGSCTLERTCVSKCKNGYEQSIIPACKRAKNSGSKKSNLPSELQVFEKLCSDIILCWKEIAILLFLGISFSVLLMFSLRYITKTSICSILIFVTIASICGTVYSWIRWLLQKNTLDTQDAVIYESGKFRQTRPSLILPMILTSFTALYMAMLYCCKGKMKMIITLFEEAAKSITAMFSIFIIPILTLLLMVVLCGSLILGIACVQTSGNPTVDLQGKVTFPVSGFFGFLRGMLYFGFIWLSQFFLACQSLIISGSVAAWYFTRNKTNLRFVVWKSFITVIKYHLGTAAFASIILSTVKPVRMVCRILEKSSNDKNCFISTLRSLVKCLLVCFESIVKYLNKNAYVMTVLYCEDFCTGSRRAVECISGNSTRLAALDGIGTFILMIIELCVSVGVTVVAMTAFKNVEGLQNIWIPAALIFILTYVCCHSFTSIYEMTIETLFICFCEDSRTNDGLVRPYFMTRGLAAFMQNGGINSVEMISTSHISIV